MSITIFVTVLSIILGLIASLFFCLGSALLTRRSIAELAGTYWNDNPYLANFLRTLKAEYLCGAIALAGTFMLQFIASVPNLLPSGTLFRSAATGTLTAVGAGLTMGLLLWLLRLNLLRQLMARAS